MLTAWSRGLMPGYRPTLADLWWLEQGAGSKEQGAIGW